MRKDLDINIKKTIISLEKASKKTKKGYFKAVADDLNVPSRHRASVNLSKIDRLAKKNDKATFVVCGKLLGTGNITKKVSIYVYSYSDLAAKKLETMGITVKVMSELINDVPKNVILVK